MAQDTKRKIIVEIEAQSKDFNKVVEDIQAKLQALGQSPSTAMKKQLQQYTIEMKSLQATVARLLNGEAVIDEEGIKTVQKQVASLNGLVERLTKSFATITLPEDVSTQINDLIDKINIANRSLRGLKGALGRNVKRLTESGNDLTEIEKTNIYQKAATTLVTSGGESVTSYAQLQSEALKLSQVETEKLTEENKELLRVYNEVNKAIEERIARVKSWIATGQGKIAEKEKEIEDLENQQGALVDQGASAQQQEVIKSAIEYNTRRAETNEKSAEAIKKLNEELGKNTVGEKKNQSTVLKSIGNFVKYQVVVKTLRRILQQTISTITTMDEAMTGMAVVTSMSREEAWQLLGTWQDLASQTGKTTSEIASMATKFYQQGRSTTEVIQLTEAAAKAATIAGIDGSRSIDLLTNAINGFQLSASQAMEVSDKFAALAASAATDYEELAVALSKVAAQANLAGMSMDFTLGLLTKGIETTKEAPETIGTALKTVISRMRELSDYGKALEDGVDVNRVETALGYIGVELRDQEGQFRDLENVLTEVGNKWETLTVNQQASVAVAMAGTRQQSRFIAMMQDFDRTLELVDSSANSYGATLAQSAKYMDGLQAKVTLLKNAWESLITSETVTNILITGVEALTSVVNVLSKNLLNILIPAMTIWVGLTAKDVVLTYQQITVKGLENVQEQKGLAFTLANTIARIKNALAAKKQSGAINANAGALEKENAANLANTASMAKLDAWTIIITASIALLALGIGLARKAIEYAHKTATDAANEGIELLEKMQVEYYNLRQSAEKVDKLAESFDELSRKINKSTEDLEELQSIVQQINDEAGENVVDLDASISEQRKQVLAYNAKLQEQQKASKAAMAGNIGAGYSAAVAASEEYSSKQAWSTKGTGAAIGAAALGLLGAILSVSGVGTFAGMALLAAAATGAGLGAVGGYAIGDLVDGQTNVTRTEEEIKQAYLKQLKSTSTGKETLRQAFVGNSEKLQSFNADLRSLLVNAAINSITTEDITEEGLNVNRILGGGGLNLDELSEEQVKAFNKAFSSNKLSDYKDALDSLGPDFDNLKNNLTNTGTLFDIFGNEATKNISDAITEFDSLGMSIEDIQSLLDGLGKEKIKDFTGYLEKAKDAATAAGEEWDKLTDNIKQYFLIKAAQNDIETNIENLESVVSTKRSGKDIFGEELKTEQQNFVTSTLTTLIENAYKEGDTQDMKNKEVGILIDQLAAQEITEWTVNGKTYKAKDLKKSINKDDPLITSLLEAVKIYEGDVASALADVAAAENALKDLDPLKDNISIKDLAQSFTSLSSDMEKFSKIAKGSLTYSEKLELIEKYPDLSKPIMEGTLDVATIRDYYNKQYEQKRDELNASIFRLKDLGENRTKEQDSDLTQYELALKSLEEEAQGSFIGIGVEQMKTVTDAYEKASLAVTKYEKALDRLDEGTDEYITTQEKLIEAYKEQAKAAQDSISESEKGIKKLIEDAKFSRDDFEIVDGMWTYLGVMENVDKTTLQTLLGLLDAQYGEDYQKLLDARWDSVKKAVELETETTKKALEERKEAYEKYFDEIDKARETEEFETDRQSLLQQMSALSGGFDTASKSRLKELKKQLRELEQKQLETQQEEERNALLADIDDSLEKLEKTINEAIKIWLNNNSITDQYIPFAGSVDYSVSNVASSSTSAAGRQTVEVTRTNNSNNNNFYTTINGSSNMGKEEWIDVFSESLERTGVSSNVRN